MGMAVFTYKKTNGAFEGRVAFHRGPEHDFGIFLFKNCTTLIDSWPKAGQPDILDIQLKAENALTDVRFFQLDSFDRNDDSKSHPKDFGWLLDLESPSLGSTTSGRTDKVFKTKLKVIAPDTTFYTYQHTQSRFYTGSPSAETKLGHVAMVMAADIPFNTIDCLSLQVGNDQRRLCSQDGLYEIYFLNLCNLNKGCPPSGDFDMAFEAFKNPRRFNLTLDGEGHKTKWPEGLCLLEPPKDWSGKHISDIVHANLNDDAPCMGGGLGAGGGFP